MKTIVFTTTIHLLNDARFRELLETLSVNLVKYTDTFSISTAEIRSLSDAAALYGWTMEMPALLKEKTASFNHFRKQQRSITRYEVIPPIPDIKLPLPPKGARPVGDLNKLVVRIIKKIKLSPGYTDAIGSELGICDLGVITEL